ncbi:hypothetical protein IFT47_11885 [Pseudomonas sp. CFBP 13711]|uniref:hypothetical protein n=1 Tax=unclassified Pseudomonas TaxID=196821 RepID=UPI0017836322|nr:MULTISPECIES: hypothetical protein [unclassified Pseudomonas]MBD8707331.1 hypothetical protein [Pseudomonas sp. CFBP 13711]MBD8711289.1 hypothetical protein [Pseudomonas sp. CFBP 13715]
MELTKDQPIELLTYLKSDRTEDTLYVKKIPASKGKAMQVVDVHGAESPMSISFQKDNEVTVVYIGMITIQGDEIFSYELFTQKTDVYFGKFVSIRPLK